MVWQQEKKYYLILNKPIHTVTTVYDPEGRTTVIDLLPEKYRKIRLFPVGRLDYFSEGLLILTNDGELTNMLIHPRFHLPKVYHVSVRGQVTQEQLDIMQGGMTLQDGEVLAPMLVHALPHDNYTTLSITLYQGINRQIRRVCDELGLTILKLVRIAEGPLRLGNLSTGEVRSMSEEEVLKLKAACTAQNSKVSR